MKKIIALCIVMMLMLSSAVYAENAIPDVFMSYPENFTAVRRINITLDDNSDLRALIDELVKSDDSVTSVISGDFCYFLSSMFTYDGTVNIQVDMSADYKKVRMSLTNSNSFSSVVSTHMNYTVNTDSGLWLDADLTNASAPKIDVIFLSPTVGKYYYANVGDYLQKEHLDAINAFLEVYRNQELKTLYGDMLKQTAKIETTKDGYTFFMDNAGFVKYLNDALAYGAVMNNIPAGELPSFEGVSFLGEGGISATYTLKNGQLDSSEVSGDISLSAKEIVEASGEEWPFIAEGKIKIKYTETVDYTKIGTTVVEYPEINDDNSISLNSIVEDELTPYEYYDGGYTPTYPSSFVGVFCDAMPQINGEFYLPLRAILEDAYEDTVSIDYNNGVVTATSENFPGFKTLTLNVNSDKVYIDGAEHLIANTVPINGYTYVSSRLFTDVFGWELTSLNHSMLEAEQSYRVSIWTVE